MNAFLILAALVAGQPESPEATSRQTALDGVWIIEAMEVNGQPTTLSQHERSIAVRNNTLTLPGAAAMHGTIRLEIDPKGTLRASPAAAGTGSRRDEAAATGARGVYVRTADYLVLTIGDPSAVTATGTGVGAPADSKSLPPVSVGQPPVSLVLKRGTGVDAPPATAAAPPPPAPPAMPAMNRMSTMMNSKVTLSDGSTAGTVQDIVYGGDGSMAYAVLGTNSGFTAVPWNTLTWDAATRASMLPLTSNQFGTIPTFNQNAWVTVLGDAQFNQRVQTTFRNFQDPQGRPLFNQLNANSMSNTRSAPNTGNPNMNRPQGQAGNPSNNPPANPAGNRPQSQTGNPTNNPQSNPAGNRPPGAGGPNPSGNPATPRPQPNQPPQPNRPPPN